MSLPGAAAPSSQSAQFLYDYLNRQARILSDQGTPVAKQKKLVDECSAKIAEDLLELSLSERPKFSALMERFQKSSACFETNEPKTIAARMQVLKDKVEEIGRTIISSVLIPNPVVAVPRAAPTPPAPTLTGSTGATAAQSGAGSGGALAAAGTNPKLVLNPLMSGLAPLGGAGTKLTDSFGKDMKSKPEDDEGVVDISAFVVPDEDDDDLTFDQMIARNTSKMGFRPAVPAVNVNPDNEATAQVAGIVESINKGNIADVATMVMALDLQPGELRDIIYIPWIEQLIKINNLSEAEQNIPGIFDKTKRELALKRLSEAKDGNQGSNPMAKAGSLQKTNPMGPQAFVGALPPIANGVLGTTPNAAPAMMPSPHMSAVPLATPLTTAAQPTDFPSALKKLDAALEQCFQMARMGTDEDLRGMLELLESTQRAVGAAPNTNHKTS